MVQCSHARRWALLALFFCAISSGTPAYAQSDVAPIMRLLKGGRLPKQRLGNVVDLVCQRGNAEDLTYIFEQTTKPDAFPADVRLKALQGLANAAQTRKVQPTGDLSTLSSLLSEKDAGIQLAALRLAGLWKVESLAPALEVVVLSEESTPAIRQAALQSSGEIGGASAQQLIERLLASSDRSIRSLGIAALAQRDAERAAPPAAELLADARSVDDVALVLDAFLGQKHGADVLAAALAKKSLSADAAKLALRHIYSVGRSDAALVKTLSDAAGIVTDRPPLTPDVLEQLVGEVLAKGDAERGEQVFRRADVSCMKCHSVSGAGGEVGPDLSPLGSTSPVDYVINSILFPDLAIKEAYLTKKILTDEGKIYQGIVVDRDDQRVVLKDATGEKTVVPVADIEEEVEGQSLMPKGLAGLLTETELLDLVRFISELGKPGKYAVRSQPTIQRWRVLRPLPVELTSGAADQETLERLVLHADETLWQPAYAKVTGGLPLPELVRPDETVLYLRGDVDVIEPGEVEIKLDSVDGIAVWMDDRPLDPAMPMTATFDKGLHRVILRVDLAGRKNAELRALVEKTAGSTASYTIVGGK